ncbi:hypothetical protein LQW54_006020 [Pestalotiopsis sp. IQ-011]
MAATRMMNRNLWRVYEHEYDPDVLERFRQQLSGYYSVLFWIEGDDQWFELTNEGSTVLLDDILSRFHITRTPGIQGARNVTAGLDDIGMRLYPVDHDHMQQSLDQNCFHITVLRNEVASDPENYADEPVVSRAPHPYQHTVSGPESDPAFYTYSNAQPNTTSYEASDHSLLAVSGPESDPGFYMHSNAPINSSAQMSAASSRGSMPDYDDVSTGAPFYTTYPSSRDGHNPDEYDAQGDPLRSPLYVQLLEPPVWPPPRMSPEEIEYLRQQRFSSSEYTESEWSDTYPHADPAAEPSADPDPGYHTT